jgi:hypothetical protein
MFEANAEIDSARRPHPSGPLSRVVSLRSAGSPGGSIFGGVLELLGARSYLHFQQQPHWILDCFFDRH